MLFLNEQTVTKANVLIVDERTEQLKQFSLALSEWGYSAHAVNSFSMLLMQISTIEPNLILININLSEIDSIDVYYLLKADPKTSHIPIIFFNDISNLYTQLQLGKNFSGIKSLSVGGQCPPYYLTHDKGTKNNPEY